jgi:creatinine amidohydrolase
MLRTLRLDFHAGFFETSVALHDAPESVSPEHRRLPPCPRFGQLPLVAHAAELARLAGRHALAGELGFAASGLAWYKLRPFPGYTGRPHHATAEAGAHFARFMPDEMAPVVERVLLGQADSPPPILSWLRFVSLGGRVGGVRLAPDQVLEQVLAPR